MKIAHFVHVPLCQNPRTPLNNTKLIQAAGFLPQPFLKGGSLGFGGVRKRAILGLEMRKSIIVSAEYGQCIYSGPLQIAEITNF